MGILIHIFQKALYLIVKDFTYRYVVQKAFTHPPHRPNSSIPFHLAYPACQHDNIIKMFHIFCTIILS